MPDLSYYHENYKNYARQNPPHKLEFYKKLVAFALGHRDKLPLALDVGCAFGHFLKHAAQTVRPFGQEPIRAAAEAAIRAVPMAEIISEALPRIGFDQKFDCITAFDVLEHVRDIELTKVEFAKHLDQKGCVVFVVPVYDGLTGPVISALDRDPTHVHKKSRHFWLEWLEPEFKVRRWWGIYRILLFSQYLHFPTRRLRNHTPAIAVVADKR